MLPKLLKYQATATQTAYVFYEQQWALLSLCQTILSVVCDAIGGGALYAVYAKAYTVVLCVC